MLMTLTTTHRPATDLGYLLRKNPAHTHSFDLSFGKGHVFYPEASEERCRVAMLLEVDPVRLVRNRRGPSGEGGALEQYVNDRPYAASSFLSVAIAEVFGSALAGSSKERPQLVETPLPLRVGLPAVPCRGGEPFLRKLCLESQRDSAPKPRVARAASQQSEDAARATLGPRRTN